ncbi:MAG: EVE domain-containing protein [Candidatus Brocadiaceae bacterium]|nr:EVE domain-containing protein [Candidatus Brocadiaceae bacterium]
MQVSKPPYQDPTTNNVNWLAIDFKPIKTFESPISLRQIKAEPTSHLMILQLRRKKDKMTCKTFLEYGGK